YAETSKPTSTLCARGGGWPVGRHKMDLDGVQEKLAQGEWLKPAEAALLLPVNRATVNRYLIAGQTPSGLPLRHRRMPSGHRLCHPDELRAIIAAAEEIKEGE